MTQFSLTRAGWTSLWGSTSASLRVCLRAKLCGSGMISHCLARVGRTCWVSNTLKVALALPTSTGMPGMSFSKERNTSFILLKNDMPACRYTSESTENRIYLWENVVCAQLCPRRSTKMRNPSPLWFKWRSIKPSEGYFVALQHRKNDPQRLLRLRL